MWIPVLKTNNKNRNKIKNDLTTSTTAIFRRLTVFTALCFLLSHSAIADEAVKIKTTPYKDIAINVTHTLGGVVPAKTTAAHG